MSLLKGMRGTLKEKKFKQVGVWCVCVCELKQHRPCPPAGQWNNWVVTGKQMFWLPFLWDSSV